MKTILIILSVACFVTSPNASAFWGSAPTSQKDYCGLVEDASAKALCNKTYMDYSIYGKIKKEHIAMCAEMFKFVKEISPRDWEHPTACLDLIAERTKNNLPSEQADMCFDLLKSSKSTANYLYCLQEFDQDLLKLCKLPLGKGAYRATSECLTSIVGFTVAQINPKQAEKECYAPVEKQPMITRSWATFGPCLVALGEKGGTPRKPSRVDDKGKVEKVSQ